MEASLRRIDSASLTTTSKPVLVSVAGCYWSGSGAVVDLLSEHGDCTVESREFALFSYGQFFHEVVQPLISQGSPDIEKLVGNIFRYREFNQPDKLFFPRLVARKLCALFGLYPARINSIRAGFGERCDRQYREACGRLLSAVDDAIAARSCLSTTEISEYVCSILRGVMRCASNGTGREFYCGVYDQLISPAYAVSTLQVCSEIKMIFVDRDWRDQYVEVRDILSKMTAVHAGLGVRPFGESDVDYGLSPRDFFVTLRRRVASIKQQHSAGFESNILWVNFEDLILDIEQTASKIFAFLGLDPALWRRRQALFPELSARNIGKWRFSKYKHEIERLAI